MSTLKEKIDAISAVIDLAVKISGLLQQKCEHNYFIVHNWNNATEHVDESYCKCKPRYQCLKCGVSFVGTSKGFIKTK